MGTQLGVGDESKSLFRCGHRWRAPRVPTPGMGANEYLLIPGGVVVNPAQVEQECCLRPEHNGPHRSLSHVICQDGKRA